LISELLDEDSHFVKILTRFPGRLALVGLTALGLLAACGDGSGPDNRTVATVTVTPGAPTIALSTSQQFTATARDADGNAISGKTFDWESSIPATATINPAGLATALAAGNTTISASVDGISGSATLTVTGAPPGTQTLTAVGGRLQRGPAATDLPVQYVVEARDGATPLAGIEVLWTVIDGGGNVSSGSTLTGADGRAGVIHSLGAAIGIQQVLARAPALTSPDTNLRNVTFASTALAPATVVQLANVPIPPNYGIHDTFVREGIAFVFAWDSGVRIFDVGNGIRGGSPSNPVLISRVVTQGGQAHNGWWFHNPNTQEKKYLFVGEEGPGLVGSSSSGDIHVVDVSNLAAPVEVATFNLAGAGVHNFWMDEQAEILYAAYYNGGVVSIDVSGTLTGNLAARKIDDLVPAAGSYVWGVQLFNGSVYASDMVNGFWQLSSTGGNLAVAAGGANVPERFTSDLWVHGSHAYSGTWGARSAQGNAVKVWLLDGTGAPAVVDSVLVPNVGTVSDVEVSADGTVLMISTEGGAGDGFQFYSLANPGSPVFLAQHLIGTGIHTTTLGYIGGRVYAFGAKNPSSPELIILDVTGLFP
jgi:hypothetical protein